MNRNHTTLRTILATLLLTTMITAWAQPGGPRMLIPEQQAAIDVIHEPHSSCVEIPKFWHTVLPINTTWGIRNIGTDAIEQWFARNVVRNNDDILKDSTCMVTALVDETDTVTCTHYYNPASKKALIFDIMLDNGASEDMGHASVTSNNPVVVGLDRLLFTYDEPSDALSIPLPANDSTTSHKLGVNLQIPATSLLKTVHFTLRTATSTASTTTIDVYMRNKYTFVYSLKASRPVNLTADSGNTFTDFNIDMPDDGLLLQPGVYIIALREELGERLELATASNFIISPLVYTLDGATWNALRGTPVMSFTFENPYNALGDINTDGAVNGADINILINILLGKDSPENYEGSCDINEDEEINGSDLNELISTILAH